MAGKVGIAPARRGDFVRRVERRWTACRPSARDPYDRAMIARIWRGTTAEERADEYVAYLRRTGLSDYVKTPGNHGVSMLVRRHDGRADFTLISYWESMEHVKAFAGDDPEVAVFYPEDDDFLIDRETTVTHHEVVEPGPRLRAASS